MGNEEETNGVGLPHTEKNVFDKENENVRIGICEMQGWRVTMEDAALALTNIEAGTSLYGIMDGHGGALIAKFVASNFKTLLKRTEAYKKGNYEIALAETFLIFDALLQDKEITQFIFDSESKKQKEKKSLSINVTKVEGMDFEIVKLKYDKYFFEYNIHNIFNSTNKIVKVENSPALLDNEKISEISVFKEKANGQEEKESKESNESNDSNEKFLEEFEEEKIQVSYSKNEEEKENKNISSNDETLKALLTRRYSFDDECQGIKTLEDKYSFPNKMGTTANVLFIKNDCLYLANAGDSITVMYKNKKAVQLNREHKTSLKCEKDRIEENGVKIIGYRVDGVLNLTRAIGDLKFKSNSKMNQNKQSVISFPEITKISDIKGIEFIMMGCDGVWDRVEKQKICEYISKEIKEYPEKKLSTIIGEIFDKVIAKSRTEPYGTDNMSCIIIQFKNTNKN